MADREKVIKGLECCRRGFCFSCPYNDGVDENTECKQKWADDALSLLKAQEPKMVVMERRPDGSCYQLKKGEILFFAHCPACNRTLDREKHPKFCGFCGKAVKWE